MIIDELSQDSFIQPVAEAKAADESSPLVAPVLDNKEEPKLIDTACPAEWGGKEPDQIDMPVCFSPGQKPKLTDKEKDTLVRPAKKRVTKAQRKAEEKEGIQKKAFRVNA